MAKQDIPQIPTRTRDRLGTRYSRRLREQGQLPAVVYGHGQQPLHLAVNTHDFVEILHHGAHLLEVVVDSRSEPVLVKDIQWDHLGENIIHVDLARVDLSERVEVELDLELIGEPHLQQEGAILDHPVAAITVKCRADSIPEKLTLDISQLTLDQAITIADLTLPQGVDLADDMDPETVIAQIQIRAELPDEDEVTAEGEQPKVIGRGAETAEEGEGKQPEKE